MFNHFILLLKKPIFLCTSLINVNLACRFFLFFRILESYIFAIKSGGLFVISLISLMFSLYFLSFLKCLSFFDLSLSLHLQLFF